MPISGRARDLIIAAEVTSRKVYEAKYRRPEWPGGASGVTVGIGYDLGMASRDKIVRDWQDHVDSDMLKAMASCAGISGQPAKALCARVRDKILIEWDDAISVFDQVDVPAWERQVVRKIPKAAELNGDCLGVLVSLAYNRGASFDRQGDRYREMRAIKAAVQDGDLNQVAGELRSMKRLWPTMAGLRTRREDEAKLWERGTMSNGGMAAENEDESRSRLASGDERSLDDDDDDNSETRSAAIGAVTATVTPVAERMVERGAAKPDGIVKVISKAGEPLAKSKTVWTQVLTGVLAFFGIGVNANATFLDKAYAFFTSPGFLMLAVLTCVGLTIYWRWKDHGRGALKQ